MVVFNFRLTASVAFRDFLHGLPSGCSIGTASLEAKLLQQFVAMTEYLLYAIFLDLRKAYNVLDIDRCL